MRRPLEALLLFGGLPALLALAGLKVGGILFPLLWLLAVGAAWRMRRGPEAPPLALTRAAAASVLKRFFLLAVPLSVGVALVLPESFLGFPRAEPGIWALVLLLYPLLSVYPQEVVFRAWMDWRYRPSASVSALAFAWAHIVFLNWQAPLLCLPAGLLFVHTYRRHGMGAVCLEHALWGNWVFTVGLGRYFYTGA